MNEEKDNRQSERIAPVRSTDLLGGPVVDTTDDAWKAQNQYPGLAHGWVQWKGTDVCMDIHCKCGELTHVDADFCYHVKCGNCGRVYMCNGHIELIEVRKEPENCVVTSE